MSIPAREDLNFRSGSGQCSAWLYPSPLARAGPLIVMAPGLGALRAMRLDAYAERFQAEGYACLVFDYRHFGASTGEPRQLLAIGRQLADWAAAIGYARTRPDVDPARLILWGTSFSGGHVIVAAARDRQIAAVISQCPFTDGLASALALHPLSTIKVTAFAAGDVIAAALRRTPVMIRAASPPGSAALMTARDALGGYLALVPAGMPFRNELAARIGFGILAYRPGRHAAAVRCPVLFALCAHDTVAPLRASLRHARRAPRAEVMVYPTGHFDIYVGEPFERAVADQIAFLQRHVPLS
jgi:pimeloyl-ACP methyl ester carboxylesterase